MSKSESRLINAEIYRRWREGGNRVNYFEIDHSGAKIKINLAASMTSSGKELKQ